MKRVIIAAVIILLVRITCDAQNKVMNPGLDSYITCPGFGQFNNTFIDDWDKPSYGSTDYYNYNCPGIIPGQQVPRSGNGYAGIIGYNYGQEYREYMTGTLNAPLNPGVHYCEFYVSLNDGYIQAIKELGAYFSSTPPGPYFNTLHIPVTPQIENTVTLLDDTSGWMKISGYFYATGGEQYITIGNFNDDNNTTIMQVGNVGSFGSYYFVDDVWVSPSEDNSIYENTFEDIIIFPNPVTYRLNILSTVFKDEMIVNLYDIFGKKISSENYFPSGNKISVNVAELNQGVYIAEFILGSSASRKKFIKK